MHRVLIGVVVFGAVIIAGIGFAGSYAAVRELALKKGFGDFSYVFPIGIDAGICVLLALDLLLTWIRIPFPLLRQTAWLLTAATIAFNGAAAWPDPLGVGMHGVIPILFVVAVEAARHAIGRIADITADKHMEGVRLTRWLLSPVPTFLLWRRMKLWELRSYDQVIKLEQERLVYQARLRSRYGRAWRRKAPVEALMPLRLAKYGVPLADTAPAGLAAAGIEPALIPPAPQPALEPADVAIAAAEDDVVAAPHGGQRPQVADAPDAPYPNERAEPQNPWLHARDPQSIEYHGGYDPTYDPEAAYAQWYAEQQQAEQYHQQYEEPPPLAEPSPEDTGTFPIPVGPGRTRELGEGGGTPEPTEEDYYLVFKKSIDGSYPTSGQFRDDVEATYGTTLPPREAERMVNRFTNRHTAELQEDHIA
ncbi:membrane protein [Streptomyces chromofuscus]|nr:membrane protein [Streptomyces chromofuscus]